MNIRSIHTRFVQIRSTRRRHGSRLGLIGAVVAPVALAVAGCSSAGDDTRDVLPRIVVSHALLGTVTSEIVGEAGEVIVLVPNGVDPHVYEPSAKDIELLNSADLVVVNGLGLEARLDDVLKKVRSQQIPIFEATDHIQIHEMGDPDGGLDDHADDEHTSDEHTNSEHPGGEYSGGEHAEDEQSGAKTEHAHSEGDPHFWTDPRMMADVVEELGKVLQDMGFDIGDRALMLSERLLTFDQKMLSRVESLSEERRVLVTGHESLGYFAERFGFTIIGTIIPGLSTDAEVSAGNLAEVKKAVEKSGVGVVFTELATPSESARVLSDELGVDIVEISTHFIPEAFFEQGMTGETYMKFIELLVDTIVSALEQ